MTLSKEEQHSQKEFDDLLLRIFVNEFEEQKALAMAKGGMQLETKEAFCSKRTMELEKAIDQSREKLVNGFRAFIKKTGEIPEIIPLFKKFQNNIEENENITSEVENTQKKSFQEIFEINDDDFLILYNIACEELNKTHYEIASDMFNFLSWLNPQIYLSMMNFGLAESLQGHHDVAKEIYETCLKVFPTVHLLHLYAADNYCLMKEKDKAKELLEQCVTLATAANDTNCLLQAEKLKVKLSF